jgi:uncharacterized protein
LEFLAKTFFKNQTLGNLDKKLLIPAVLLDNKAEKDRRMEVVVFENFSTDHKDKTLYDCSVSSASAPTYFPAHNGYVDGG